MRRRILILLAAVVVAFVAGASARECYLRYRYGPVYEGRRLYEWGEQAFHAPRRWERVEAINVLRKAILNPDPAIARYAAEVVPTAEQRLPPPPDL
jgi:hypothetical protein